MAFCGSEGWSSQKALTVATMVLVIGLVALGTDFWRDGKFASGLARGIVSGLVLGSNAWSAVWPHQPGLTPANVKTRVLASGYEPTEIFPAD
jgi:hypothetical protein